MKGTEDMEEKDSWQREQCVQMPHIRDILLEELKESQYENTKKRENEKVAEARSDDHGNHDECPGCHCENSGF